MPKDKLPKQEYSSSFLYWEPKHTSEGYVLSASDPNQAGQWVAFGCSGLFIAVWLGIWCSVSFIFFGISIGLLLTDPSLEHLFMIIFSLPFVAIGVVGLAWVGRFLYQRYRIKDGELILPTYPLYAGETYRVRYHRKMRSGQTAKSANISAIWLNYEWIQYYRGTDLETMTHELSGDRLPEQTISRGVRQLEYTAEITIPPDAKSTIYAPRHNQLRWELQVNVHLPRIVNDTSFFKIRVLSKP